MSSNEVVREVKEVNEDMYSKSSNEVISIVCR